MDAPFSPQGCTEVVVRWCRKVTNNLCLTGPEALLKNLFRQLGISLFTKDNLISHSLNTLLIDESGRIVHIQEGSKWDPDEFLNRLNR